MSGAIIENAPDRAQRILAVIPWIVEHPGTPLSELSNRFGWPAEGLRKDLELVFCDVGLYPFTPDVLVEVDFDNDCVTINLAEYFHRPARLTHAQALTLLAGGRAVLDRSGLQLGTAEQSEGAYSNEVLRRAVAKIALVLGEGAESAVEVTLGPADPQILQTLRSGLDQHCQLRLSYYSYGRDDATLRTVDPYRILSKEGHWYLFAYCHLAQADRLFRVDRIQTADSTTEVFEQPEHVAEVFETLSGTSRSVELVGPEPISWVADAYPFDTYEAIDENLIRLVIPVSATPWLERLLLCLDPSTVATEVLTGESLTGVRSLAAQRILRRYESNSES
ncbi:MAG: WYL domain-containing protein [Microthrixaceae bacterium]